MADNVQTAMFEILKGIQQSIVELRGNVDELRRDMGRQFESFAQEARKDRRTINGVMALLQAASGHFSERIRERDNRVPVLEGRAG